MCAIKKNYVADYHVFHDIIMLLPSPAVTLSLPWAAARRRMLLFPPETRALWDLVAGLRLLVGVLLSGVPLPLSLSRSPLSLSRTPEGGIASNICSMLENPGAQIEADLVFRRSEFSAIFLAYPVTIACVTSSSIHLFTTECRVRCPTWPDAVSLLLQLSRTPALARLLLRSFQERNVTSARDFRHRMSLRDCDCRQHQRYVSGKGLVKYPRTREDGPSITNTASKKKAHLILRMKYRASPTLHSLPLLPRLSFFQARTAEWDVSVNYGRDKLLVLGKRARETVKHPPIHRLISLPASHPLFDHCCRCIVGSEFVRILIKSTASTNIDSVKCAPGAKFHGTRSARTTPHGLSKLPSLVNSTCDATTGYAKMFRQLCIDEDKLESNRTSRRFIKVFPATTLRPTTMTRRQNGVLRKLNGWFGKAKRIPRGTWICRMIMITRATFMTRVVAL